MKYDQRRPISPQNGDRLNPFNARRDRGIFESGVDKKVPKSPDEMVLGDLPSANEIRCRKLAEKILKSKGYAGERELLELCQEGSGELKREIIAKLKETGRLAEMKSDTEYQIRFSKQINLISILGVIASPLISYIATKLAFKEQVLNLSFREKAAIFCVYLIGVFVQAMYSNNKDLKRLEKIDKIIKENE